MFSEKSDHSLFGNDRKCSHFNTGGLQSEARSLLKCIEVLDRQAEIMQDYFQMMVQPSKHYKVITSLALLLREREKRAELAVSGVLSTSETSAHSLMQPSE